MKQLRFLASAVIVAVILFAAVKTVWLQQVVQEPDPQVADAAPK